MPTGKIFDIFTPLARGRGLGLAITREIIKRHGTSTCKVPPETAPG
ncbi:MAG: hypothetical protein R3C26_21945 [Calditrichia bacterium]